MARSRIGRSLGSIVLMSVALTGAGYGCGGSGGGAGPGAAGNAGAAGGVGGRGGSGGSTAGVAGTGGAAGAAGAGGAAGASGAAGAAGGAAGAGATGGAAGGGGGGGAGTSGSTGSGGSAGAGGSGGGTGTGGSGGGAGTGGKGGAGTGGTGGAAGTGGTGGSAGTGGTGGSAGTGGGAGSAGTGGSAGSGGAGGCTPTGPESCFNGLDDDCDGEVDCADLDCAPIAECVPDVTGFQLGTTVDPAAACPTRFGAGSTTLNQGLNAPATCTGCSATPALTCTTTLHQLSTCPGGTATDSVSISSASCANNGGPGYNWTTGAVHVDPLTPVGMCIASGTPAPTPLTWQAQTKFCATQQLGGGCATGDRCVPKVAAGGKHCVAASGSMACPSNYTAEGAQPWYAGVQDGRSCGATCNYTPAGASCGTGALRLYLGTTCSGLNDAVPPNSDTCALDTPLRSFGIMLQNTTLPTCSPTNTAAGAAVPNGPQTLCCL